MDDVYPGRTRFNLNKTGKVGSLTRPLEAVLIRVLALSILPVLDYMEDSVFDIV